MVFPYLRYVLLELSQHLLCRLRHKRMTNTQNRRAGGTGGWSCHQAKWTVNIFTVRVISSLDLFQQGLPEGSFHWPPGMNGLMRTFRQSLLEPTNISELKGVWCFLHYERIPAQTRRSVDYTWDMLNLLISNIPALTADLKTNALLSALFFCFSENTHVHVFCSA